MKNRIFCVFIFALILLFLLILTKEVNAVEFEIINADYQIDEENHIISDVIPETTKNDFKNKLVINERINVNFSGNSEYLYTGEEINISESAFNSFENNSSKQYTVSVMGDVYGVNGTPDGIVSTLDLSQMIYYVVGYQNTAIDNDLLIKTADITKDNVVNIVDITNVIHKIVYGKFPNEKEEKGYDKIKIQAPDHGTMKYDEKIELPINYHDGQTIRVKSRNEDIATGEFSLINGGIEITPHGIGRTVITVISEETESHIASYDTYILTIQKGTGQLVISNLEGNRILNAGNDQATYTISGLNGRNYTITNNDTGKIDYNINHNLENDTLVIHVYSKQVNSYRKSDPATITIRVDENDYYDSFEFPLAIYTKLDYLSNNTVNFNNNNGIISMPQIQGNGTDNVTSNDISVSLHGREYAVSNRASLTGDNIVVTEELRLPYINYFKMGCINVINAETYQSNSYDPLNWYMRSLLNYGRENVRQPVYFQIPQGGNNYLNIVTYLGSQGSCRLEFGTLFVCDADRSTLDNAVNYKMNLSEESGTVKYPNRKEVRITNPSGGQLTFTSSNENVARAYTNNVNSFIIQPKGPGTARITVQSAATPLYKSSVATYDITVQKGDNAISIKETSGTLDYGETKLIGVTNNCGANISVRSSNTSVAKVYLVNESEFGITPQRLTNVGEATITISVPESEKYEAKEITYNVTVNPAEFEIRVNNGRFSDGTKTKTLIYGTSTTITADDNWYDYGTDLEIFNRDGNTFRGYQKYQHNFIKWTKNGSNTINGGPSITITVTGDARYSAEFSDTPTGEYRNVEIYSEDYDEIPCEMNSCNVTLSEWITSNYNSAPADNVYVFNNVYVNGSYDEYIFSTDGKMVLKVTGNSIKFWKNYEHPQVNQQDYRAYYKIDVKCNDCDKTITSDIEQSTLKTIYNTNNVLSIKINHNKKVYKGTHSWKPYN